MNGEVESPAEPESFSFSIPDHLENLSSGSPNPPSPSFPAFPDLLRFRDELQHSKKNRESNQNRLSPSAAASFAYEFYDPAEAASSAAAAAAAELLTKHVQAAALSAVATRLKPSAPARIVCMALLWDKSRCKLPGLYPDDGDLWFCVKHRVKQKFGVIVDGAASPLDS